MPTVVIPEKVCPHCGGTKWYHSEKKNTYECFAKVADRKIQWQRDNYERYMTLAKERRRKFRELNPLKPRPKMSEEEKKARISKRQKEKYKDPEFRKQAIDRAKKHYRMHVEQKREYNKQYGIKNADQIRVKQTIGARRRRNNLSDCYLKFLITQKTSLSQTVVPKDVIEIKRKELTLKRKLRNHENKSL